MTPGSTEARVQALMTLVYAYIEKSRLASTGQHGMQGVRDSLDAATALRAALRRELYDKGAERLELLLTERKRMRNVQARCLKILSGIHGLLSPPLVVHGGKTYRFANPDANETLAELTRRIKAIPGEIEAMQSTKETK